MKDIRPVNPSIYPSPNPCGIKIPFYIKERKNMEPYKSLLRGAKMAKINNLSVRYEHRICTVDGRPGYFHCWEQYYDVISPGLTVGSHPGGQYARVFGIVEFNDGVARVDIHKIKFADDDNAFLSVLEKHYGNDTGV